MTGTIQNPLPNSSINGKGETLKPIRCEYTKESSIKVSVLKTNELKYTNGASFQEFDTAFNECIKQKMEDTDVDELKIELPESKYPEQAKRFKNFVFLDLIGMLSRDKAEEKKDEEKLFIEINRRAVLREYIDGVFVFPEERNMIDPIIFRQMCKCGLWSNCDSARPPKLTIVAKMRKGDKIGIIGLEQSLDGFCQFEGSPKKFRLIAKNIQEGICQAFDYGPGIDYNYNVDVLPLQNKAKHVPEMLKRVATLYVLEKSLKESETDFDRFYDEQAKISVHHLEKILDDIRHYKNDSNLVDMLGYVQSIANELQIKLKSNALMKKFEEFDKYIESNVYSRSLRGNNNDISIEVEDFVTEFNSPNFDMDEENLNMEGYDYAELRQQVKRKNLMYLQIHFLSKITNIHEAFIFEHITNSRIRKDAKDLIDMEKLKDRATLQELKVEFRRLILPIRSQDTPFIDQTSKKKIFELVKLNDPYSIFGKVITDNSMSSLEKTKEAKILIDMAKQLHDKIKTKLKIENR